jgi:hypothetical protein
VDWARDGKPIELGKYVVLKDEPQIRADSRRDRAGDRLRSLRAAPGERLRRIPSDLPQLIRALSRIRGPLPEWALCGRSVGPLRGQPRTRGIDEPHADEGKQLCSRLLRSCGAGTAGVSKRSIRNLPDIEPWTRAQEIYKRPNFHGAPPTLSRRTPQSADRPGSTPVLVQVRDYRLAAKNRGA